MVEAGAILSGRYLVVRELAAGGMGVVFEATDLRTGGRVAVKCLHAHFARDPQFIARLGREARIAASIRSPRAVRVLDLDADGPTHYLVMEYVAGEDLAEKLERQGRLAVEEALDLCIEIGRALEGAHAVGVVHRDLKPNNVKVTEEGEVKVLDFGIARVENQPGITGTNVFTGTPEYCAPERLDGLGDIRSDIYSVGVMLYELVAGVRPFTGPTAFAVLRQHRVATPPPLPVAVPVAVQQIIARAMAKDPADRFQTPTELVQALWTARTGSSPSGRGPSLAGYRAATPLPGTVVAPRASAPALTPPPTPLSPLNTPPPSDEPGTLVAPEWMRPSGAAPRTPVPPPSASAPPSTPPPGPTPSAVPSAAQAPRDRGGGGHGRALALAGGAALVTALAGAVVLFALVRRGQARPVGSAAAAAATGYRRAAEP
ncbi:MAG: serine/threonine-protein kinase [Dehalococcoidia bacterium]